MSIQLFYNSAVSSGPFWAADCKDSIDSEHLVPHAKIPHEPIAFQSTHKKHIMLDVFAVSSCHVTNSYKPHACKLEMIPKFNLQLLVRVFHQQVHPAVYEWFRSLKTTRPCISIPNIRPVHSLMHTLYSALLDSWSFSQRGHMDQSDCAEMINFKSDWSIIWFWPSWL